MKAKSTAYRTPQEAIEAKLAPYRRWVIQGFVEDLEAWHKAGYTRNEVFAVATMENVTVYADPEVGWHNFALIFCIEGIPARTCQFYQALLTGMAAMKAEIERLTP